MLSARCSPADCEGRVASGLDDRCQYAYPLRDLLFSSFAGQKIACMAIGLLSARTELGHLIQDLPEVLRAL